jgi:hypothetical protein
MGIMVFVNAFLEKNYFIDLTQIDTYLIIREAQFLNEKPELSWHYYPPEKQYFLVTQDR